MEMRCPGTAFIGEASIEGMVFAYGGYSSRWRGGIATLKPYPGERALGMLYRLSEENLQALDRFENVPHTYLREEIEVIRPKHAPTKAWVYLMRRCPPTPPSTDYHGIIAYGYGKRNWSLEPLCRALAKSRPGMS